MTARRAYRQEERRIIRVFPRRTRATPDDDLTYTGPPDLFAEADEVHVSVTFTWDKARAEELAEQWRFVAPVKVRRMRRAYRQEERYVG